MTSPDSLAAELVQLDNKTGTVSKNPDLYTPSGLVSAYNTFMWSEGIAASITQLSPNEYVSAAYLANLEFASGSSPPPPAHDKLLLADGTSALLQTDGTSKILI
jgi:hypothetical protein